MDKITDASDGDAAVANDGAHNVDSPGSQTSEPETSGPKATLSETSAHEAASIERAPEMQAGDEAIAQPAPQPAPVQSSKCASSTSSPDPQDRSSLGTLIRFLKEPFPDAAPFSGFWRAPVLAGERWGQRDLQKSIAYFSRRPAILSDMLGMPTLTRTDVYFSDYLGVPTSGDVKAPFEKALKLLTRTHG